SAGKYRCKSYTPRAGTDRSVRPRTMGVVNGDDHHGRRVDDVGTSRKNNCRTSTRAADASFHLGKGRRGAVDDLGSVNKADRERISLQVLYPPAADEERDSD